MKLLEKSFRLLSELCIFLLNLISPKISKANKVSVSFRSCVFSYALKQMNFLICFTIVSVSFRSCVFSYKIKKDGNQNENQKFPSPFGVVYFLIKTPAYKHEYDEHMGFRLLSELCIFLCLSANTVVASSNLVSVSFRSCVFSYPILLNVFYCNVFRAYFRDILVKN